MILELSRSGRSETGAAQQISHQGRPQAGQADRRQRGGRGSSVPEIQSNVRTIPGIISQRGCTYAGCKGVVLGPTRDIVNITHGPIGCGFYSWLTRRNQTRPNEPGRPQLHDLLLFHGHAGRADHLRGREEAEAGGAGGLRPLQAQGHRHLRHLPGGPHRRRRPRGGPGDEGKARDQRLRLQLRGLQGGEPVGGPPHRQQRHLHPRGGPGRHRAGRQIQDQHAGGIQHRRRRLRDRAPHRGLRHHPDFHLQRQLQLRPVCQLPHRGPEPHHVPPLHQLRGGDDGDEVRHPLDQGQLHRGRGHGQVAAQDRHLFRRPRVDRHGWKRSSPGRCRRWKPCGTK